MGKDEMKKGFICECGERHEFGMWVAAHWGERLVHTCPKCGRVHNVCRGRVTLKSGPKK